MNSRQQSFFFNNSNNMTYNYIYTARFNGAKMMRRFGGREMIILKKEESNQVVRKDCGQPKNRCQRPQMFPRVKKHRGNVTGSCRFSLEAVAGGKHRVQVDEEKINYKNPCHLRQMETPNEGEVPVEAERGFWRNQKLQELRGSGTGGGGEEALTEAPSQVAKLRDLTACLFAEVGEDRQNREKSRDHELLWKSLSTQERFLFFHPL